MAGILALLAHPDDEFFCSGLLAAAGSRGVPIHLAYWTRGEGGMSPKRRAFWNCLPRSWNPRVAEARRSASVLGAASLTFLGSRDPAPNPEMRAPLDHPATLLPKLQALLAARRPEILLTHGSNGDYGHPAHVKLHQITRPWLQHETASTALVTFNAFWPGAPAPRLLNANDPADFILDTRSYARTKLQILRAHSSQRFSFISLTQGGSLRTLLRWSRWESYHCCSEGPARELALAQLKNWTAPASDPGPD
jgi:LmbE family N-acetylglucosaminyl deacetylase